MTAIVKKIIFGIRLQENLLNFMPFAPLKDGIILLNLETIFALRYDGDYNSGFARQN